MISWNPYYVRENDSGVDCAILLIHSAYSESVRHAGARSTPAADRDRTRWAGVVVVASLDNGDSIRYSNIKNHKCHPIFAVLQNASAERSEARARKNFRVTNTAPPNHQTLDDRSYSCDNIFASMMLNYISCEKNHIYHILCGTEIMCHIKSIN